MVNLFPTPLSILSITLHLLKNSIGAIKSSDLFFTKTFIKTAVVVIQVTLHFKSGMYDLQTYHLNLYQSNEISNQNKEYRCESLT